MSDFPGTTTLHGVPAGDVAQAGQAPAVLRAAPTGDLVVPLELVAEEDLTEDELAALGRPRKKHR